MLKGVAPCFSPELLKVLAEMGHGDELVLADVHFPDHTFNDRVLRADGLCITTLLDGILRILELDSLAMMAAVPGDKLDPKVEASYMKVIRKFVLGTKAPERVERFAFYERAKKAFAVVITRETAKDGNIILKKGVSPV